MATVSSCQGLQIQQERQRMQLYGKADHWRVVWSSCAVASSDILMVHLVIYSHSPSSPLSRHRHRPTRHNAAASRYLQARHAYNFSFDPLVLSTAKACRYQFTRVCYKLAPRESGRTGFGNFQYLSPFLWNLSLPRLTGALSNMNEDGPAR